MTIFWTIFAGVCTFVIGQIIIRLIIEPVHEFKRTVSDIALALINHAHIYCNPGVVGEKKETEVAIDLRALASRINAQMYLIPKYEWLAFVFGLPKTKNVSTAMRSLIGISNSVHKSAANLAVVNGQKSDKICELLNIHMPDEDKFPESE